MLIQSPSQMEMYLPPTMEARIAMKRNMLNLDSTSRDVL